ncbi:MAG: adenylate cyclase [Campylobacteraceae bacterium 4484_4]|nr:MAG: adenylate cyclase [Campylobacteraceae bacterium 4484_4]
MATETERKFLLKDDSWPKENGVLYMQGYLSTDPERVVRVRVAGEKGYLTIKGKSRGISRLEFEYEIPREDALQMLEKLALKPIISKYRYKVPYRGFVWEIDRFLGENEGLVIAEVELEDPSQIPPLPPWVGKEVTGDERYYNASLISRPYREWKEE